MAQVTPENCDLFLDRLDQIVKLVDLIDSMNCPWSCWEEVLARNKMNMDEMG